MAELEQAGSQAQSDDESGAIAMVFAEFSTVKKQVRSLIDEGQHDEAIARLQKAGAEPADTRFLEESVWLFRQLGDLCRAFDREPEALVAYEQAYALDPRDRSVLQPLSELLLAHKRSEEGIQVVQALLLHHKRELAAEELCLIYRRLGALHEAAEDFDQARQAFEKALEQMPSDPQALTGLLRMVGQIGEPSDVVDVRLKLINSLENAQARSMALVALGDDWNEKFNDPGRALDTYEQAVAESPSNRRAIERIAGVAREMGDARRVSRAFFTLSKLAKDDAIESADWLIKSCFVARDELWEPDKALTGFRMALELDPTRLDAFKAVTSILVDAQDWEGLEAAYVQLIGANQVRDDADPKLLAVLWQKLGDLYKLHLDRVEDAIFAYDQASQAMPDNIELHEAVAELAEVDSERLDLALRHLEAMRLRDPERSKLLDRIGRVYLRKKDGDRALCMFRALAYTGQPLDEKALSYVKRLESPIVRPLKSGLTADLLQHYVFSDNLETAISDTFTLLKPVLEEYTGESRAKYNLKRKDRVKLDEKLAFNNLYKAIGDSLGYRELPELWHKPEQIGLINGALIPEGLIVGDEILGSGREKHIAFVVGKQLFLFLKPFYLAAIRPLNDLEGFFLRALAVARPELDLASSLDQDGAFKELKKRIKGAEHAQLVRTLAKVTAHGTDVDLGAWLEAVEDTANRVGFIFCDDLKVCEDYLQRDPQPISGRSVEQRMQSLVDYSVSEKYLSLRPKLGINAA
ncbi:MAG: tetratricopeptide repeat protein [Bradymonadaceae bacterium]|nr:tetratricopeptide repeat protein [Lujinxingiaceae bacterium]